MDEANKPLPPLFIKNLIDELTAEDQHNLDQFSNQSDENKARVNRFTDKSRVAEKLQHLEKLTPMDKAWHDLELRLTSPPARTIRMWRWYVAAGISLLVISAIFYWNSSRKSSAHVHAVDPGSRTQKTIPAQDPDQPFLTLADGSTISLESARTGIIARQKNIQVNNQHGELTYYAVNTSLPETPASAHSLSNTLTIPRGKKYKLRLEDGSAITLNAASSLSFPVGLVKGQPRNLKLKGEGYFEVASTPDSTLFHVNVNEMNIEVRGTHFNVRAYEHETIKTTLLAGLVKVTNGENSVELKPGQQARLENGVFRVVTVDSAAVIAWNQGLFNFVGADMKEVIGEIERWYKVKLVYDKLSPNKFNGYFSRTETIESVVATLKDQFNVEIEVQKQ